MSETRPAKKHTSRVRLAMPVAISYLVGYTGYRQQRSRLAAGLPTSRRTCCLLMPKTIPSQLRAEKRGAQYQPRPGPIGIAACRNIWQLIPYLTKSRAVSVRALRLVEDGAPAVAETPSGLPGGGVEPRRPTATTTAAISERARATPMTRRRRR